MKPTRVADLLAIGAVATVLSWLAVRHWYGDLPRLSWFVPISLLLLALVELVIGIQLRARIRRRPGTVPVHPLVAARSLPLAKASALVGVAALGVWAGLLCYTVPRLSDVAAASDDTRTGVIGAVASASLVGAALWLEYCCRAPRPPDDRAERPTGDMRPG